MVNALPRSRAHSVMAMVGNVQAEGPNMHSSWIELQFECLLESGLGGLSAKLPPGLVNFSSETCPCQDLTCGVHRMQAPPFTLSTRASTSAPVPCTGGRDETYEGQNLLSVPHVSSPQRPTLA